MSFYPCISAPVLLAFEAAALIIVAQHAVRTNKQTNIMRCRDDVVCVWAARACPPPPRARQPRLDSFVFYQARHTTRHTCPVKTVNGSHQANLRQVNSVCARPGYQLRNIVIRARVLCNMGVHLLKPSSRCYSVTCSSCEAKTPAAPLKSQRCCSISSMKYWCSWNIHEWKLS